MAGADPPTAILRLVLGKKRSFGGQNQPKTRQKRAKSGPSKTIKSLIIKEMCSFVSEKDTIFRAILASWRRS